MTSILIVDDEEDIRDILKYNLENEGFQVETAKNGEEGLAKIGAHIPDLVILDIMMPGMDGIEVCERIRANALWQHILVCMLTARSEDFSQIAGLDAGADVYVAKPIRPKVLLSRVRSLLRRSLSARENSSIHSRLQINRDKYIVLKDGVALHLPRKEFELLDLLASKPDVVFERDVILEKIWGTEIIVGDRTIDVHIRKLREKIGDDYITTVKGVGYKFSDPEA